MTLSIRTRRIAAAVLVFASLTVVAAQDPPWGAVAYDAEVAIYVDDVLQAVVRSEVGPTGVRYSARDADDVALIDALLTWDGTSVEAWTRDGDGFEPAPELKAVVLGSVLDPATPEVGLCASEEVSCSEEGGERLDGRATRRLIIDQGELGVSTVWVDEATGISIASEGSSGGSEIRSELVRIDDEAPDPARLRP